jgi:phosphoserine phosphatase
LYPAPPRKCRQLQFRDSGRSQQAIDRKDAHIVFYSDDISDSPTLDFADEGYAVNPSKRFAEVAAKANWGVLDFCHAEGVRHTP